jgi:hypothetical protein
MNARMPKTRTPLTARFVRRVTLVGTFAVMICATGASAQAAPIPYEERLRTLFGGLSHDETIQLVTPEILVENAKLVSLEPATVELRQIGTGVPISVDLAAIRGVSVQRRHWLQGTIWGIGGGVLAGSVFGLMIGSFNCTTVDGCGDDERRGAVIWGTTLGIVGGGIGFTLGRRDVYWYPIFP